MIYIGIGANLKGSYGNPKETSMKVLNLLNRNGFKITSFSSLWYSFPMPASSGPIFVNSAVKCIVLNKKYDYPDKVLVKLNIIENIMGRKRKGKNYPRTIDLDLLDFKGVILNKNIILPHPRIHLRKFVLCPLLEIEPNWIHPLIGIRGIDILRRIKYNQVLRRIL